MPKGGTGGRTGLLRWGEERICRMDDGLANSIHTAHAQLCVPVAACDKDHTLETFDFRETIDELSVRQRCKASTLCPLVVVRNLGGGVRSLWENRTQSLGVPKQSGRLPKP